MGRMRVVVLNAILGALLASGVGCGSSSSNYDPVESATGGAQTGGANSTSGGATASGGNASGGNASGGDRATGGAQSTGGAVSGGGGASGGAHANGGADASGGALATGGTLATGGAEATGGSGGATAPGTCPATPPTAGEPCNNPPRCFYDACPSGHRTLATCNNLEWTIEEGASCEVECPYSSSSCPAGTYCRVSQGGALFAECAKHTCGTGPFTSACTTSCPMTFSLEGGATATCNTCPQGGCP